MNYSLNINQNELMDKLEARLGAAAAWPAYRALMEIGTLTISNPSTKKVVAPVVAPKQKAKPTYAHIRTSWTYREIGIGKNYILRNKDSGFMFRVLCPDMRNRGLAYEGRDTSRNYPQSMILAMLDVCSFAAHDRVFGAGKTVNLRKWEVLDPNGNPIGRTVMQQCQLHGYFVPVAK